jgi:hypothetical protein
MKTQFLGGSIRDFPYASCPEAPPGFHGLLLQGLSEARFSTTTGAWPRGREMMVWQPPKRYKNYEEGRSIIIYTTFGIY